MAISKLFVIIENQTYHTSIREAKIVVQQKLIVIPEAYAMPIVDFIEDRQRLLAEMEYRSVAVELRVLVFCLDESLFLGFCFWGVIFRPVGGRM